jgi:tRNA-Thr(GGU) m(6)t(6)A37 methyltransferase TsaA
MKIELKTVKENQVASISHVGPVEEMGELIGELTGWVIQKGLQVTQPPFVVYYTSPMEVSPEKMEYEVGIPFNGNTNGDAKVKIKIIPKHKTISTIFKGPYQEIGPVYAEIMQHIMEGKYEMIGAPREAYLNNPTEVPENELLTEVIFPVIDLEDCENPTENVNVTENTEITIENPYTISPIGYTKRKGMDAFLEIKGKYIPGLKELDNFSHVIVLWLADKIENRNILQMYPPYSLNTLTGVFASRAEYRPNPIAVTTCKILDINEQKGIISVANLDAVDGTPIIDLKPYMPSFDRVKEPEIPKRLSFLWPEWVH